MRVPIRLGCSVIALLLAGGVASAADQRQIDAAVRKGTDFLKSGYKDGGGVRFGGGMHGVGPPALSGLALLEAGVPIDDPALKNIIANVRFQSFREFQTYQVSLCLLFLDRLGDPADVGIIQMLGVRLLAGQNNQGGWTYSCVDTVNAQDEQRLRVVLKEKPPPGKLHPEIEKYYAALWQARTPNNGDDNSNTQFAVLAVWVARRHAVPVEAALDLIDKRFMATQHQDGGWAYTSGMGNAGGSTGSMTCAGLLGLATGVARREEKRNPPKKDAPPPKDPKDAKGNDPFFNPPAKGDAPAKKGADPKRPLDARDLAAQRAFHALGQHFNAMFRPQGGGRPSAINRELYFLWSVERVGVIFGVDKIGGTDWYDVGADFLIRTQHQEGYWPGNDQLDVNTSFAILFLLKSNLARDMASKVKQETTELRAGTGPGTAGDPGKSPAGGSGAGTIPPPKDPGLPSLPPAVEDDATKLAGELLRASPADWSKALERFRDTKGGDYTKALVVAIYRLDGEKQKEVRQALAERLTRMTADTLRTMMKSEDRELRRAAVLACAMKDDKSHVPDLIDRLTDDEELVVRAAKAGLKSLTGQDFGPAPDATREQRKAAADAWRAWWAKQKK